ncbi:hypothetical protein RFI_16826, partial [Reticulomyxa filosa]
MDSENEDNPLLNDDGKTKENAKDTVIQIDQSKRSPSPTPSNVSFASDEIAAHLQGVDSDDENGHEEETSAKSQQEQSKEELSPEVAYGSTNTRFKLASSAVTEVVAGEAIEGESEEDQKRGGLKSTNQKQNENDEIEYNFPEVSQETWSHMARNTFICWGKLMVGTDISFFFFTN